jgi:hypothetical protein
MFDARLIRKHPDRFAPYESRLSEWTRSEILPLEGLGLGRALGRASLLCLDKAHGTYRVRWTWPQQRFADQCLLAISRHEPDAESDPRDLDVLYRLPLDRPSWESGGGSRVIHVKAEWADGLVIVWAMVDLGFRVFASHPLVIGSLDAAAAVGKGPGRRTKVRKLLSSLRGDAPAQEPGGTSSLPARADPPRADELPVPPEDAAPPGRQEGDPP